MAPIAAEGRHARPPVLLRALLGLLRWRYIVLGAAAFGSCVQHVRGTGQDWSFFLTGSELLFGRHGPGHSLAGGFHLYANYPQFQIGPLSLIVATPFRLLAPGDGRVVAAVMMTVAAPVLVLALERSARACCPTATERDERFRSATVLLGGLVLVQSWATLATIYAHLDDVLTLAAAAGALWAVATRRPVVLGLALGIAVAAKPWGVIFLPLAGALTGRDRRVALAVGLTVGASAWAGFVLADPRTLDAIRPQTRVADGSVLHLLGVALGDGPAWTRVVQLGLASAVGILAVVRGRWAALPLVVIAVRLALDPGVYLYYTAGMVFAALAWDLLRTARPLPVMTLLTFVCLGDASVVLHSADARAVLRLVLTVGVVVVVLFLPDRSTRAAEAVWPLG